MTIRAWAAAVCLLLPVLLGGCDENKNEGAGSGTQAAAPKDGPVKQDSLETEKWNSYVAFGNKLGNSMVVSFFEGYFKNFDPTQPYKKPGSGFAFKENRGSVSILTDDVPALIDAAIASSAKQPQTDLDRAVAAFAPSVKELWVNIGEANKYYINKIYIDDSFAQGEKLHTKIMEAYKTFGPANEQFRQAMNAHDLELVEKDLRTFKEEGKTCRWASLRIVVLGRKLVNEMNRQNITENNVRSLDLAAYRPFYDELTAGVKELEAIAGNAEALKKEGIPDYDAKSMLTESLEFKRLAAALIEESQKPKDYRRDPSKDRYFTPKFIPDALNMVVTRYNQLGGR